MSSKLVEPVKPVKQVKQVKLVETPFIGGSDDTRLQMLCSKEEFWKLPPHQRFKQLWLALDHTIWNHLPPEEQKKWFGLLPVIAASLSFVFMIMLIIAIDWWLG